MRIPIWQYAGMTTVLAGKAEGRRLLSQLLVAIAEPREPTVAFLDFTGIEVATGSFLREGPLAYRDAMRAANSNLYPIFSNCSTAIIDDLRMLLDDKGDATLVCDLSDSNEPTNTNLVGKLDEKQYVTYCLVRKHVEVDAVFLKGLGTDTVGTTAWNNRLAGLAAKALVVETTHGRSKRFRASA
jgi:hypothetical protein